MQITLKQMRYYVSVLEKGSFAHAAKDLDISQSSIVAAIGAIETLLGQSLFTRVPARGLIPTDLGVEVGRRFARLLKSADDLDNELATLVGNPTGTIKLGCYVPSAPFVLPPVLKALREDSPNLRVDIWEGDFSNISEMLVSGQIDVALTYHRHMPEKMPFKHLFNARPWALLPNDNPLSRKESIALSDLANLPMVLLDLPGTEKYFRGLFEAQGLDLNISHSTKSAAVVRGLVGAGFGFSILNICGPSDRSGALGYVARPVQGDLDAPRFGVSYREAAEQSPLVLSVLRACTALNEKGAFRHVMAAVK